MRTPKRRTAATGGSDIVIYKRGKHLGHALEAHCRALVARLSRMRGCEVCRDLPFEFPVHPDVVVIDDHKKLRALGMVSYCSPPEDGKRASDNSSLKFYRTRFEYNAILKQWVQTPSLFASSFKPFILIYGSRSGWKPSLVEELKRDYPTTLFLPDHIRESSLGRLLGSVWDVYREALGKNQETSKATARVFEHFSDDGYKLSSAEDVLASLLRLAAFDSDIRLPLKEARGRLSQTTSPVTAPTMPSPFRSRYRQGLALAATFSDSEISAWQTLVPKCLTPGDAANLQDFARKALFMDLAQLSELRTLVGSRLLLSLRRPEKVTNNGTIYAPEKPDFEDWLRLDDETLHTLLGLHRALPTHNAKSFGAGALDQIGGNWREFSRLFVKDHSAVIDAIASPSTLRDLLIASDVSVDAESWQPSSGAGSARFWWSVMVCVAATVNQDRRIFRGAKVRRAAPPSKDDAAWLASIVTRTSATRQLAIELIRDARDYCDALQKYDLTKLSQQARPALLDIGKATSFTAWWYGALTTNPSYNPLSWIALGLGSAIYPKVKWNGFPNKRSGRLSAVMPDHEGRVEWSLVGAQGRQILCIEPRTITANNIGNKTKEIFDRIEESRQAARRGGFKLETIGVLDGDFDETTLSELTGQHGYDRVFSADDAVRMAGGVKAIGQAGAIALAQLDTSLGEAEESGHFDE